MQQLTPEVNLFMGFPIDVSHKLGCQNNTCPFQWEHTILDTYQSPGEVCQASKHNPKQQPPSSVCRVGRRWLCKASLPHQSPLQALFCSPSGYTAIPHYSGHCRLPHWECHGTVVIWLQQLPYPCFSHPKPKEALQQCRKFPCGERSTAFKVWRHQWDGQTQCGRMEWEVLTVTWLGNKANHIPSVHYGAPIDFPQSLGKVGGISHRQKLQDSSLWYPPEDGQDTITISQAFPTCSSGQGQKTEFPQEEIVQNTLNTLHPQLPYRSAVGPLSHPIGAHQGHLREKAGTRSELKVACSGKDQSPCEQVRACSSLTKSKNWAAAAWNGITTPPPPSPNLTSKGAAISTRRPGTQHAPVHLCGNRW